MQSQYRMRRNAQFQHVYRRGRPVSGRFMTLIHVSHARQTIVGFSVSKKVGGSVQRNYVKRRLREAFRKLAQDVKAGNYVVVARAGAQDADYHQLSHELRYLLRKGALFRERSDAR